MLHTAYFTETLNFKNLKLNTKGKYFLISIISLFGSAINLTSAGLFGSGQQVTAELITETTHVQPGMSFNIGLKLNHDPHWHTYWINPGTGYATSLNWDLPKGFEIGSIQWPVPVLYRQDNLVNYVLEKEALLIMQVKVSREVEPGTKYRLKARADWLMCDDSHCVPGDANLEVDISVESELPVGTESDERFAIARQLQPKKSDSWTFSALKENNVVLLKGIVIGETIPLPEKLYFFSLDGSINQEASQILSKDSENQITMKLELSATNNRIPKRLRGVLAPPFGNGSIDGKRGLLVDIPLITDISKLTGATALNGEGSEKELPDGRLGGILLLAFAGGLILNLMPCVFPVLGIKVLGFVQQAGQDRKKVMYHGFAFTIGVLVSFWILSGILLLLRAGGQQLGWGFQLQSPIFILGLTIFLFIFGLNLSGVFEFAQSAVGIGSRLMGKEGLTGSFFSGVLATVVSTPCAAPFLAPALGTALTLPPITSILIFTFIALGLSTPYLLLSISPKLVNILPRPGEWMETFKQLMAFPLYATAAYLFWGYIALVNEEKLLNGMIALTLIALGVWVYGRFCKIGQRPIKQKVFTAITVVILAAGLYLAFKPIHKLEWQPWSQETLTTLRNEGRTVYVDFTARWCATCQVNKRVVFGNHEFQKVIKQQNIALLKADWTNRDPKITEELRKFNRSAVPFNLIYKPNEKDPIILPEILTPSRVMQELGN